MDDRSGPAPTQPGGSYFHRPQRAWHRTGRTDRRSGPNPSARVADQYGNVNRKRFGAQAGSVLILLIDGREWAVRLPYKGEQTRTAEAGAVRVLSGSVAKALQGRLPGEEVWLITGNGLPKPYGRRVQVRVLEVTPAPSKPPGTASKS